MLVIVAWLGLMAVSVVWEVHCHRSGPRWTSLSELVSRLGGRRPGRIVLVALWAFVGWHVFARYTLPR
jgi:sirohydrochlorin ferrochelatase